MGVCHVKPSRDSTIVRQPVGNKMLRSCQARVASHQETKYIVKLIIWLHQIVDVGGVFRSCADPAILIVSS